MVMVKTSVTIPQEDLEEAQRRGLNVSAIARRALRDQLNELTDDDAVSGYAAAFADTAADTALWDQTAGDGIENDEMPDPRERR
jgi:post-segregation antitoxin (ccd killing protein)